MTPGRLIAVVGPSGVGKDSVMRGISTILPQAHLVRRVITRAPELGGEDYDAVTVPQFHKMAANGAFVLHWGAHGLHYGIPVSARDHLARGTECLANFSRKALLAGADAFADFVVLNMTAKPETLRSRLTARGRETSEEIEKRLAEAAKPLPEGLRIITLSNDGDLSETVARAISVLQPASV